jgi:hypothetical protein
MFNFGFDFTDEASYLQLIKHPNLFKATATQFGFIYSSLFKFINFNIPLLRQINFIFLFTLTIILNYLFIKYILNKKYFIKKIYVISLSFILSLSILPIYTIWIPTPNYNLLNFKSIILTLIGILLTLYNKSNKYYFFAGWLIIGFGGCLTFLAKPTSALCLGLLVLELTCFSNTKNFKYILIPIFTSVFLLFLAALYIDGSIELFINRFCQIIYEDKLAGTHDPSTLFSLSFTGLFIYYSFTKFLIFLFLFFIGFLLSKLTGYIINITNFIFYVIVLSIFISFCFIYLSYGWYAFNAGHLIWAPALGAFVQVLTRAKDPEQTKNRRPKVGLVIFLALLPLAYGFGSNNSIHITTAFSSYFLLLAFIALLRRSLDPRQWLNNVIGLSICSLFISSGILFMSLANPYRQAFDLWNNKYPVSLPKGTQPIYAQDYVVSFVVDLQRVADNNGFVPGNVFIDLSGRNPGAAYAIGGLTPGTPWIFSGYPGSQDLFRLALKKIPCQDLAKAWLLMDMTPIGITPLNPKILQESGLDFNFDYMEIGRLTFPVFFPDGRIIFRDQKIFKPQRKYSSLLRSCEKARNLSTS